ncbi:MAG TPA: dihydropteroate synthase [Rhodopila sp.]|uniref:dihydropteroate synthase n=1 Tax=Rhodopila sp. TaxID=2480087 RepID=UPI002D1C7215|nr:dihydropteroate synthase [Rhodopila sp.]HVY18195.1 dihydropteroate synthase [Rhodopila sp.]
MTGLLDPASDLELKDRADRPAKESALWAGLTLDRPRVMGILNLTPDSFSDGGRFASPQAAIEAGLRMAGDGADIIDVGGESTRPGAAPVTPAEEQHRVLPVIKALAAHGLVLSIDTRNAATMRAAIDAGARIVNDVSGLAYDAAAAEVVATLDCPVVLMHMRGTPDTMNDLAVYRDVPAEVRDELAATLEAAVAAGIRPEQIVLDPGIGFAKLAPHSLAMLRGLPALADLGRPLLVGVSRKSFIGRLSRQSEPGRRLGGSLAAGLFAIARGAAILRVHDVAETVQAIRVWQTLCE